MKFVVLTINKALVRHDWKVTGPFDSLEEAMAWGDAWIKTQVYAEASAFPLEEPRRAE